MGIKTSLANTIWSRAWQQQSTAPLASFRILFGMLMVWATVRFAVRNNGKIRHEMVIGSVGRSRASETSMATALATSPLAPT